MTTTPIYDFLVKYSEGHPVRPHMPGHKGKPPIASVFLETMYKMDITEIEGADSLFEASGIIAESEQNATELFKTKKTVYSAGGSTLCIQAMMYLMKQEKRHIFAARNCHKSFLNACVLLDLDVTWLYPVRNTGLLSASISAKQIEDLLSKCKEPACVYITSPDYMGNIADIASISKVCKKYNARLVVDNAHGAHLAFCPINRHPINLGADLCCDSAHKMLPALTGAAYLHTSDEKLALKLKDAMSVFGSTSPNYLILCSLDLCNLYIDKYIREDIPRVQNSISKMQKSLAPYYKFIFGDTFHVTIDAGASGITGYTLAEYLKTDDIFPEYVDNRYLILLFSPVSTGNSIRACTLPLLHAAKDLNLTISKDAKDEQSIETLKSVMNMRKAALSDFERVPVDNIAGEICGSLNIPCPPAIPFAVPGEQFTASSIELLKKYGIKEVNIVKE